MARVRFPDDAPFYLRNPSEVAQRKRVGLITQRSVDRNHPSLPFNIQTPWGISSIGRVRALQARGTGIETRILHHFVTIRIDIVAQMVERKTLNLVVVGSIPTEGVFSFSERVRLLEARVPSKFSFSPLRSYGVMVST